ncbi:diaminopimelate decarboxylase [Carnobacterium funditum]|uniref:diaminopimelate decarboxylase n=1 Tax=Carnobacterium funditum TaxID=2752 RepID=UPI0005516BA8|nr:diaminopimelate decarboxylase [Carnobacterium funditum]
MDERLLTGTMKINETNHLEIGGIDTVDLVKKYGTPLYVYDIKAVKQKAQTFKTAFSKRKIKAQVAYASKAFSCLAIYQVMAKEGMSLDVVSGGELYTAIKAEYPSGKIHFHGNNKSDDEIIAGLDYQIGCFVVDNFHELDRLNQFTTERKQKMTILIRVTPGVEAHTHDYISTGQSDSKFGFDLENGQAKQAAILASQMPFIDVIGLHSHIGSQIFELEGFNLAINKILDYSKKWKDQFGFNLKVLNVGGGFGIQYTIEDKPMLIEEYIDSIISEVESVTDTLGLEMPEIWVEPGRSLVGDAGITLYETGSQKSIPEVRNYLAIDGGMSDNIRPALYGAKYTGVFANRVNDKPDGLYSIAGKCCESGDMLIWDLPLPGPQKKDILAVFSTGAYGYAMANNYNRIPRPPVIFVENGIAFLAIQRESYSDLMKLEHSLI